MSTLRIVGMGNLTTLISTREPVLGECVSVVHDDGSETLWGVISGIQWAMSAESPFSTENTIDIARCDRVPTCRTYHWILGKEPYALSFPDVSQL